MFLFWAGVLAFALSKSEQASTRIFLTVCLLLNLLGVGMMLVNGDEQKFFAFCHRTSIAAVEGGAVGHRGGKTHQPPYPPYVRAPV